MHFHGMMRRAESEEQTLSLVDSYRLMLRLLAYVRPYRILLSVTVLSMFLYAATEVVNPWLIKEAVDSVITTRDTSDLTLAAVLLVVNATVGYGANYVHLIILSRVGQNLLLRLRTSTFNHMQRLSISYFDRTEVGANMSRVQNDVQQLQEFLSIFTLALGDLLRLAGFIIAMLLLKWELALITLTVIPLLFAIMILWQRYAWRFFMRVRRAIAEVNAGLQENISGVRVIQSLNRQEKNLQSFDRTSQGYLEASLRASRLSSALNPSVEVLTAAAIALVIVFGGMMVLRDDLAVSVLVAFALYIQRLFDPIRSLTMQYGQLQRAMTSGQHIFEMLDMKPEVDDKPGAVELPIAQGDVVFENVSFSYTSEVPVLKNINLHIKPGEKIALVGPTGAGKTTMVSLLSRLYDVTEGSVRIDGHDLRDVTRESLFHTKTLVDTLTDGVNADSSSLSKTNVGTGGGPLVDQIDPEHGSLVGVRKQISVVPQEPFLFSGTIKDNIRYSRPDITDQEIIDAAKVVGAHDFIAQMEKGYDTGVEERGVNFSPGQRQLISLARALVSDPRIVILDEATATVDSRTELFLQRALKVVLEGRTALIIAHRLSTVRSVDRIVVVDQGRLVEEGTHQQLLAKNGLYARLYALNQERE